ncbi:MAG: SpoIIE family protein phosphatase [bacterium]
MTLKLKLIFIVTFTIIVTVAFAGYLGYRTSQNEIKKLAKELIKAKTEHAYSLCEHDYKSSPNPSQNLKQKIAEIQVSKDGYISVLGNTPAHEKGILIVHPSNVGTKLYYDIRFPHIKGIIDEIDAQDDSLKQGYGNFTYYRQQTEARGRQNEKKIGYFKYFKPWNWVILATGYEKDVYASRDEVKNTALKVVLLVIFVGILMVYFIIRQMFKPVQRLTESTREVARGNWDISIDYKSNDEIGILAQSFEQMVHSLRENARMWHEFNVAREMQSQMLPKTFPEIAGLQISAKSIPAKEVGGDFYDFLGIEDGKLGIVVGDVSGHGVSAAMVMTAAMSAVRFAAEEKGHTDDVLDMVNNRLSKDMQSHMFVALFYGIIDPRMYKLLYTNAGQTMPFIWRDGQVSFLPQAEKSDRFPLGIVRSTIYEQLSFDMQQGDILIFYTDGIVDAMNGHSATYGFERFAASISKHAGLSPTEMVEQLVADMQAYSEDNNFHDDVTLVIVKII